MLPIVLSLLTCYLLLDMICQVINTAILIHNDDKVIFINNIGEHLLTWNHVLHTHYFF
jgi:hypothetical protein